MGPQKGCVGNMQTNSTKQYYLNYGCQILDLNKETKLQNTSFVVLYKRYKIKIKIRISTTFKYSHFLSYSAVLHFFITIEHFEDKVNKISKLDKNILIFGSLYSCGLHKNTWMARFHFFPL